MFFVFLFSVNYDRITLTKLSEILNVFRFDSFDVGIAFEIFGVEGQQIFDVVLSSAAAIFASWT